MKYLPLILGAGVLAATAIFFRSASPQEPPPAEDFAPQTNAEEPVSVTVAPQISANEWAFSVTLDTHSVDLEDDMAQISRLIDGAGNEYAPNGWTGDPPGGHHRTGTLAFAPIAPAPGAITLLIRDVGGVRERRFTWQNSH